VQGWETVALAPPVEPDPDNRAAELETDEDTWSYNRVLVSPSGAIYTVSGTSLSPGGRRTTARRVDGKTVRLGRETSSLDPTSSFLTADGTLWNADSGELKRFEKGRWETVAQAPQDEKPFSLRSLNTNGPPWLLLDGRNFNLWRLDHGVKGHQPQLTPVEISEGGKTLRIDDAIAWSDDSLPLATDAGLRAYSTSARKLSRVDFPEPPQPATTLVRDGLGRLWLGGGSIWTARASSTGLWLVEPGAKAPEALDRVPWIRWSEVYALAPDPHHADGVIAALGSRGVAFVRAGQRP
jgi:hypothetical protein